MDVHLLHLLYRPCPEPHRSPSRSVYNDVSFLERSRDVDKVDFGVTAPTKKTSIQERLERAAAEREENHGERPSTAQAVERKLELAAERREKIQNDVRSTPL
jgi:hypothetical protein